MGFKKIKFQFLFFVLIVTASVAKAQCGTVISTFPYSEGFESSAAWTTGGTNSDWAWGTPSHPTINSAGGGSKCWTVGGLTGSFYNYSEQSWIMSPCFDFSSLNYPWISFKIFWEDEWKYDGMVLQYSLNSGTTWTNLGAYGDAVNCLNDNWYNYNNITWLTASSPKHGWTGRAGATSGSCQGGNGSLGWVTAKHCMSSLAGQPNVRFRFLFGSGTTCNSYDGISIDDIFIDNAPPNVANFSHSCINYNTLAFTNLSGMCPTAFTWNFGDPVSGSNNTSNLANPTHVFSNPGTYNVSLTASGPCNASNTITMPVYILGGGAILQAPTCAGLNDGYITCTIFGGAVPNSYAWATGDTTQTISGLAGGTYTVTVTSGVSCPLTSSFTLFSPSALTASATATPVNCFGGTTGTATITPGGGTGWYNYSWAPSGGTAASASGLSAGTYTVTVTDAHLCATTATAVITGPASAVSVSDTQTPVSCFGGNNGTANALAIGGTSPYTYSWTPSGGTSSIATTLTAGNYTVNVTDSHGCISSATATITQPASALTATTTSTPSLCTTNNGTASVIASGGTAPYMYSWSPTGAATASITGLGTGTYTVAISDANGCTLTPSTTVANSGSITANISSTPIMCYGGTDGTAAVSTTGGTAPVSYAWNSGQTTSSLTNLNAGNYCVSVTDANGCTDNACVNIVNPPEMIVDFTSDPSVTDMTNPEIHFTDQSVGGTIWVWNFGDTTGSTTENPTHFYNTEGTYPVTLVVTNSMGCIDSITHSITIDNGFTFYAPNAFSPDDANGINDTFLPKGTDWNPDKFNMWIFDRWGNMIYHTSDMYKGWRGTSKNGGSFVQNDVYVWKVVLSDKIGEEHQFIGSVTVVR